MAAWICGCGSKEPTEPAASSFAGREIRIAVPAGLGLPEACQVLADEWSAHTGATHRIVEYDPAADEPLDKKTGLNDGTALAVFPISQVASMATAGQLAPFPRGQDRTGEQKWNSVFQGLRENIASHDRSLVVLPISCPVLVCYYRGDLIEKAGLQPPATWADYETLLATRDTWAGGLAAVEPWGREFRATMFLARAVAYAKHPANYSLFFDIGTGEPLIDRPGFVRALADAKKALALMPAETLGYTPADCRREILGGRAALAIAFETGSGSMAAEESDAAARAESQAIGFCRLPGSPDVFNLTTKAWEPARDGVNRVTLAGFGGLAAGVSSHCSNVEQQAAWNLLETLAGDRLTDAFPGAARSPCREEHLAAPEPWVGTDLTAAAGYEYLEAVADSLRSQQLVAELAVPAREKFLATLAAGITRAIEEGQEPEAALGSVAAEWRQIADGLGRENVTNQYRRSLGLPPQPAK